MALSIEDGYVSPRYGLKQRAPVVRFSLSAAEATFFTVLYHYSEADKSAAACAPSLSIEPWDCSAGSAGIRIAIERGGERIIDELSFAESGGLFFERRGASGPAILRYSL